MHMFLIVNIFLVEVVQVDFLFAVGSSKQLEEILLELIAVVIDIFLRIFADEKHLSDVGFGLRVHFEAILVTHLPLADLRSG